MLNLAGKFITGLSFGFVLEKAKVYMPNVIQQQFVISNPEFLMMRMFLAATATGCLCVALMESFGKLKREVRPPTPLGFGLMGGYGGNVVGGAILGMGMALSGSCPGTAFLQVAAGVRHGFLVLGGGMVGSLLIGAISKIFENTKFHGSQRKVSIDEHFNFPYIAVASAFSAILIGVLFTIEERFPWYNSLVTYFGNFTESRNVTSLAWDPAFSGVLLGLTQILSIASSRSLIGNSGTYDIVVGKFLNSLVGNKLPYFKNISFKEFLEKLYFPFGVISGAYLSLWLSDGFKLVQAVPVNRTGFDAFIGGIMILFGARLAKGCTSGHGVSGMAELSVASLVTVANMFAGAFLLGSFYF